MPKRKAANKLLKAAVSSRVDPDLQKQLVKAAMSRGITVSQYIEEIIAAHFASPPK